MTTERQDDHPGSAVRERTDSFGDRAAPAQPRQEADEDHGAQVRPLRQSKHPRKPAVCQQCGDDFMARVDSATKYCSVLCSGRARGGERNPRYKGGLCYDKGKKRWLVHCRDSSIMLYSRAVMAGVIGRLLSPTEIVHHRNEDTTDDRPENLQLTTRSEHIEMHRDKLRRKAAA